jgi:hypothetical protein
VINYYASDGGHRPLIIKEKIDMTDVRHRKPSSNKPTSGGTGGATDDLQNKAR